MAGYEHLYWWSSDGLRLHARDYPGRAEALPLVCLPGLTRNARDYEMVAGRFAGERRVICAELRGRGESAYAKDPMSYVPLTYARDIAAMLDGAGVDRFIAVGTSLGGIVTMLLAGMLPGRIAGVVLNDVGPAIEPAGLARIRGYVGRSSTFPTWVHAARGVQEGNADVYPDYALEDWIGMAKRLYRLNPAGRIVLDYDMKIAEPFRLPGNEAGPDMWRAYAAFGDTPVLIVRGERSDILSASTAECMAEALPRAELVTVARVGHAPTLTEDAVTQPLARLLARAAELR